MTLKCERAGSNGAPYLLLLWLALLVGAGAYLAPPVMAQDDGTQLPPPPKLKHHQQEAPDADFQSPLKRDSLQSDGSGQGGNGQGGFNNQRPGGQGVGAWPQRPGAQQLGGGDQPGNGFGRFGMRRRAGAFAGGAQGFGGPGGDGFGGPSTGGQGRGAQRFGGQGAGFGGAGAGFGGQGQGAQRFGGPGAGAFAGQGNAAGFAGQGFAAGGARGRMQMGMPGARKPLDLTPLNLSAEQKQHIRDIRKGTREEIKSARQTLVQRQLQLRSMLFSSDANDADIRAARKQLRAAQNRVDDLGVEDLLHIRGVLTAEQRQKLPGLAPPVPQSGAFGPSGGAAIGIQKN